MADRTDVVIVGGGAAGCAVAYELAQAGLRPTIVEREGLACGASGYSAGGINPLHGVPEPLAPLALESYRLHLALWDDLRATTGRDPQARLSSMIMVVESDDEVPPLEHLAAAFRAEPSFSADWLDRDALRAAEPRLGQHLIGGLRVQGNGVLDSYEYTVALAEVVQHLGGTVLTGEVTGLERTNGHVTGVRLGDRLLACEQLVLAMGPWSADAEAWLGLSIPIEPVKGEIVRLQAPAPPPAHDIVGRDGSVYSRGSGIVWCGTTYERRGFDREPSEASYRAIRAAAARLMPVLAEAPLVKHTACLRPVASDDLPIAGRVPGLDNVYLATGCGKKGILFSTGLGRAIADLILTGSTNLSIGPCTPERFAVPA